MNKNTYVRVGDLPHTVTVVGNGPLSEQQRAEINQSDYVIRFNDYYNKNYRSGERIDEHMYQSHIRYRTPEGVVQTPINSFSKVQPFKRCSFVPRESTQWSSLGTLGLAALENNDSVQRIDIYGMNWNFADPDHDPAGEAHAITNCCEKCVVHKTPSENYAAKNL